MTTATVALPCPQPEIRSGKGQRVAARLLGGIALCLLFSIIFAPEFAREGAGSPDSVIYQKAFGGFRLVDLAIVALGFFHLLIFACVRWRQVPLPRSLAVPGGLFLACIPVAMLYGRAHHGSNVFFDWRGLALGIALYFVWAAWLEKGDDLRFAVLVFAAYVGVRMLMLYVVFANGTHEMLLGLSIPVFDGPTLSCIVFAGLLGLSCQRSAGSILGRVGWTLLMLGAYLMVLLCMRRTYWVELALGTAFLMLFGGGRRIRALTVGAVLSVAAACLLGQSFTARVQSLDLSQSDAPFSADNADHVNDLVDAWEQVRQSPVMGIGLGTSYMTWHIRRWKPESVMVHNAPLHVWLKYGLAGVLCYLWFHLALLRWVWVRTRSPRSLHPEFLQAAFAFLAAQFAVSLTFAPWPYSETQSTMLLAFVIAAAVIAGKTVETVENH